METKYMKYIYIEHWGKIKMLNFKLFKFKIRTLKKLIYKFMINWTQFSHHHQIITSSLSGTNHEIKYGKIHILNFKERPDLILV